MKSYSFDVKLPFSNIHTVFSNPRVLDSVHGTGLWTFSDWDERDDGSFVRTGAVKGVEVPTFARFLNKGKKYIVCHVDQRYIPGHDSIRLESTTTPKIAGTTAFVKNTSSIVVYNGGSDGCHVHGQYSNTTSLPHPLGSLAVDVMDEMSDETVGYLQDALR